MHGGRSARIECAGGSFWVTPKVFWRWVREGIIDCLGEHPLSGRYKGESDDFQVSVKRVIMDLACPEHLHEFLRSHKQRKA